MPCAVSAARWSSRSRRARSPPWIAGCKVLTRPSSISGEPVTAATSVTGSPASASVRAELPVETSATPRSMSARANGTMPLLSLTEISARRIGRGPVVGESGMAALLIDRMRAGIERRRGGHKGVTPGSNRRDRRPRLDQLDQIVDDKTRLDQLQPSRPDIRLGVAVKARAIGPGDPGLPQPGDKAPPGAARPDIFEEANRPARFDHPPQP